MVGPDEGRHASPQTLFLFLLHVALSYWRREALGPECTCLWTRSRVKLPPSAVTVMACMMSCSISIWASENLEMHADPSDPPTFTGAITFGKQDFSTSVNGRVSVLQFLLPSGGSHFHWLLLSSP